MKILTTMVFAALFSGAVFSQDIDQRLLKSYTQEEVQNLIDSDKEKYNLLVSGIGRAIEVADYPKGKGSKITQEISIPEGDFTYLDLGLKIQESNQYFKITGTDKVLVVKSFFVLKNESK
jgi:hypothetical protein